MTIVAAPPPDAGASSQTMKLLLKEAVAPRYPAEGGDGGTTEARQGPDLEKLPFTPLSIQKVVTFYAPQIQSCYEETLAGKEKAIEGTLMTAFLITPEGLVKKPQVRKKGTTVKDPRLHACVVTVLGTMEFPKPPDGKNHPIEYPFNLKAIN